MSSDTQNRSPKSNNRSGNQNGQPRRRNNNNNYNKNKSNSHRRGVPQRRSQKPAPKPLTFWQKILKAIGLYKEPTSRPQQKKQPNKKAATSNTRVANKGEGAKKKPARTAPPQKVESSRLYVGNLSYDVGESDLIDLFKGFGNVKNVEIVYNKRTQRSKGFAFVEMMNVDDAKRASEVLHEQPFMGRNMIVNGARTQEEEIATMENPAA